LARWPDGKLRAGGAVARWRYSTALAERHARRHPDGYLIVRFEDLVQDVEATLRRVCQFIGASYEPAMLWMGGAPKLRQTLEAGGGAGDELLRSEFVGRYVGALSTDELAFIQLHLGRRMRAYGYVPDRDLLTTVEWLRFAVTSWPRQASRFLAWRSVEAVQQWLPRWIGRKPGRRMYVDAPLGS
jgi:hypothetical protein